MDKNFYDTIFFSFFDNVVFKKIVFIKIDTSRRKIIYFNLAVIK